MSTLGLDSVVLLSKIFYRILCGMEIQPNKRVYHSERRILDMEMNNKGVKVTTLELMGGGVGRTSQSLYCSYMERRTT